MKIRRLIKTIEVERAKQIVTIDMLLPGDAHSCLAIQSIIHGNIISSREIIPNFGEYSFEFNAKKQHPATHIVSYINPSLITEALYHHPFMLPLDVSLTESKLVTGFYRDLNELAKERASEFLPYKVKFIFHLKIS